MSKQKFNDLTISRRTLCIIIVAAILIVSLAVALPLAFCSNGNNNSSNSSDEAPEKIYYSVTLDYAGLKSNEVIRAEAGTRLKLTDPVVKYYEFKGWFANEKFTEWFDFDEPIYSDVTIYAQFEDAVLDRATYFERFNGDAENISSDKFAAKSVLVYGKIVISDVAETKKDVSDGFISFSDYKIKLFYTEEYLKKAFYENENYEIISESYSFRGKRATSGFTITYKDKTDGETYSFLTVLDENHRLSAAQLKRFVSNGPFAVYTVYINKYIY